MRRCKRTKLSSRGGERQRRRQREDGDKRMRRKRGASHFRKSVCKQSDGRVEVCVKRFTYHIEIKQSVPLTSFSLPLTIRFLSICRICYTSSFVSFLPIIFHYSFLFRLPRDPPFYLNTMLRFLSFPFL